MDFPADTPFNCFPDSALPGWYVWELKERGLFNDLLSPMRARPEDDGRGRVRIWPGRQLGNTRGNVHGGTIMGFIDMALFCGAAMAGAREAVHAVTLDCAVQFLAGAAIDHPLDALVEVLRETRRLIFLRGDVLQGEQRIASFSGIIRKTGGG